MVVTYRSKYDNNNEMLYVNKMNEKAPLVSL